MKTTNRFFVILAALSSVVLLACNDEWEKHYLKSETIITNDQVLIVDATTDEFLQTQDSLSVMYEFLKTNGIFETLKSKDQLHTLFIVQNNQFVDVDSAEAEFIAQSHITDISISPSNLYDGERILMWHGKYVSVSLDSAALQGAIDHIRFNNIAVRQVIKTKDGYIYVLNAMIQTLLSLFDVINNLDEDYSIFKELVTNQNVLVFDRENSKPTGVDITGNTIYDSTFIISNPFFEAKNFDLTSEALTATVMIPSNKVINDAMNDAKAKLADWEMTRDTNILRQWILEVAFFNTTYTPTDLLANTDITSIYNRQWRTTVQQVDTEHPISISNGIAYMVNWLKIPNNMLMYRLKDFFYYYESCTEEQKAQYYVDTNLVFKEIVTDVTDWTTVPGVWPTIINRILTYNFVDPNIKGFALDFIPIKRILVDGVYEIRPWKIPPGEYTLGMGFKQSMNLALNIYIDEEFAGYINVGSETIFHYDRGAGGYPEGYKEALDAGLITHSKKGFYDRDGGQVAAAINISGDYFGNPAPITIRIENLDYASATKVNFHHWCLRPTSNNY